MSYTQQVKLKDIVAVSDLQQLTNLMQQADVELGNWNGRHITVKGYEGSVTFSEVSKRAGKLFNAQVSQVLERNEVYAELHRPYTYGQSYTRSWGPIAIPLDVLAQNAKEASAAMTLPPEISEIEENQALKTIEQRDELNKYLTYLDEKGTEQVVQDAKGSCLGKLCKRYDKMLDNMSDWRFSTEPFKVMVSSQSKARENNAKLRESESNKAARRMVAEKITQGLSNTLDRVANFMKELDEELFSDLSIKVTTTNAV